MRSLISLGTILASSVLLSLSGCKAISPSGSDIVSSPLTENTIYVDGVNGADTNDGLSVTSGLKTLRKAINVATSKTRIFVMDGEYNNNNFGGGVNNGAIMTIKDKTDILLANYPGHSPVLRFDGSGGVVMLNVERIEIRGLEIVGPNQEITLAEAQADRLVKSKKFLGRGIVAWSGNNIRIHQNKVHHCPHSGIRVDKGDYIAIEDNEVYSNTWWGSSAESAIVIAEATHIDQYEGAKIFLQRNIVYDNRNFIPFYNAGGVESEGHSRPDYGTANQTYIIDGSGVYVTRNKDKYFYGRMWLNYNKAFNNGINGLVVHKTDRAQVIGNVLWDNGKVPKTEPESRQPYAGLTLNYAVDVEVRDNYVKTERNDDYAYMAVSGSVISEESGNNKVEWVKLGVRVILSFQNCKVAAQAGTGFGLVQTLFQSLVSTTTWTDCKNAQLLTK